MGIVKNGRLLANVSNKETWWYVCYNLACSVHIRNMSNIASKKKSLKLELIYDFKLRFD